MKLKPRDIKRYNKIAEKGRKPVMVRVGHKWYTWYEGDPKPGVLLTTQSGRDVEFDFKQIDDIEEGTVKLTKSKLKEMIREELLNEKSWEDDERIAKKISDKIDKGVKRIIMNLQHKVLRLHKGNYAAEKDMVKKQLEQIKDQLDDVLGLVYFGR